MSGPIATAVSAIFGFEASVASFIASIVTGTISGGVQVISPKFIETYFIKPLTQ